MLHDIFLCGPGVHQIVWNVAPLFRAQVLRDCPENALDTDITTNAGCCGLAAVGWSRVLGPDGFPETKLLHVFADVNGFYLSPYNMGLPAHLAG